MKNAFAEKQEQMRLARLAAREDAEKNLKFIGETPFAGIPADRVAALKLALVEWSVAGAVAAVGILRLNGKLQA